MRSSIGALALVLFVIGGTDTEAGEIPKPWLDAAFEACIAEDGSDITRKYCRCAVNRIQETMTDKEFLLLSADTIEAGDDKSKREDVIFLNDKMSAVLSFCLRQAAE